MRDHPRLISFAIVLAAFVVSAMAFPHLPDIVPIHWSASGTPNGYSGRIGGAFGVPGVMLLVWLIVCFAPRFDNAIFIRYDNRDSDASTARPVYNSVFVVVLAFMLAVHVFAMMSALGIVPQQRLPLFLALIVSVGMILIGNYLPQVTRRNAFVGVRFPWAYASEEVWRRTQRAGGYGMVAAGIVGLMGVAAFPASPMKPVFAAILAQLIIVGIYSYAVAHSSKVP